MSINVTVTGNPINIQKGSMVTASPNHSKKEFERRRLIRLSQVRQQSKNIAEEVRNRVRRQKLKQVEEIEKEGQKKLKQWQAKKLLELQNQYHEALRDIGAGHKSAILLEDEADVLKEKKENDSKTAKQRASVAHKKLQEEKEKQKTKVSVPIQKKKLVREIEDKRSQLLTTLKRSSESIRKRSIEKVSTETEVSGIVTESDGEYEDIEEKQSPKGTNIQVDIEKIGEISAGSSDSDSHGTPVGKVSAVEIASSDSDEKLLRELTEQRGAGISDRIKRSSLHRYDDKGGRHKSPTYSSFSTKGSKQGKQVNNVSKAGLKRSNTSLNNAAPRDVPPKIQQNIYTCSCKQSPVISCHCAKSSPRVNRASTSELRHKSFTDDESKRRKTKVPQPSPKKPVRPHGVSREIPVKPKVTLKSVRSPNVSIFSNDTVQQLQSQTRSTKAIITNVEKITEDSLRISPDVQPDMNYYDRMIQRDNEAFLRGQKALEREKLQRDYNELMKKLPALQKMERLNKMNQDKPEYHMNEERLLEQERKKQSILDNTYEKLFPDRRPPTITIPIKNTSKSSVKEKDPKSDDSILNLGAWDADKRPKKLYTEEEVEAMLREGKFPSESKFKTDQLKSVLEKLRKQKEELLKEIQSLPDEMETLSKVLPTPKTSSKKNAEPVKQMVSARVGTSSKIQSSTSQESVKEVVKSQAKQVSVSSKSVQTTKETPPEVTKSNQDVQTTKAPPPKENIKTLTKPKQEEAKVLVAPSNSVVSLDKIKGDIVSCECKKDGSEVCEIVIKIKDGKSSEVLVKEKTDGKEEVKTFPVERRKEKKDETARREREVRKALQDDCCRVKPESWHEKLSRNTSQVSNSSTSYLSPPALPNKKEATPYYSSLIGKKPQQSNLNGFPASPPTKLPAEKLNVLEEIQRLLNMSRMSIDELGVSTVSTVTTPSQSVIDLESNKPLTSSRTNGDSNEHSLPNFSFLTVSSESRTLVTSEIDGNSEQYPDILAKYAKIADQCSQRISSLSAMIQKVREEKNRMLQTPSLIVTNDSSTRYMDLPSPTKKSLTEKYSLEESKLSSSSSSGEGRDVLDINYSLAEKLKSMTPAEISEYESGRSAVIDSKAEEDLALRLKALKAPPVVRVEEDKTEKQSPPKKTGDGDSVDFVPLLLDIPKMPPFSSEITKRRKPPPSKGFLAARKLTDDSGVPHELSTIPEQDSQTRLENTLRTPQTPRVDKKNSLQEIVPEPKKSPPLESKKVSPPQTQRINESNSNESAETPLIIKTKPLQSGGKQKAKVRDLLNFSDNSFASSNTSGDEKIEMFRIEAMLKSIGMDWAISTLRKTQETLALTSSSSSIDLKTSTTIKELSGSEMKEYLTKQLIQKISSSTLKSDASPGSLNETHELSGIQNGDFSKKLTSTPVNRSRELNDKSSDLPSAIEVEKDSKDFFSLPEHSI